MVSQLPCQMIRPNCSRFPGIDLLPHRAPSAFSKSSELLLDLQVGLFCTRWVGRCIFGRSHEFLNSSLIFGNKAKKNQDSFFLGPDFSSEVVKPTHVSKTEGGELRTFPWIFRGTSVRNIDVEPSEALVIHPE